MQIAEDNGSACKQAAEIVSFLYDDLDSFRRNAFEQHLSACKTCAAELVETSKVRESVIEWRNDALAEIDSWRVRVPELISRPEIQRPSIYANFLAGIRQALARTRWLAFGSVAAAMAALALVMFYGVLPRHPNGETSTVKEPSTIQANSMSSASSLLTADVALDQVIEDRMPVAAKIEPGRRLNEHLTVAAKDVPRSIKRRPGASSQVAVARTEHKRSKAASPSEEADEDDNSLRLSDLFEQIGS